mmetsp:Transcript_15406/g.33160  ORF Transcript_15406/g.33160 Transcript_15406/m.33160 type:complete len:234 (-) Transcript_15406:75-776(-)
MDWLVATAPPTMDMMPTMARRPFHVSASLVMPTLNAGMKPAGVSSLSPSSRSSLSWKLNGAIAAATDTSSTWMCAIRITARSLEIGVYPPKFARVPHSDTSMSPAGSIPWPLAYAVSQIASIPNMAWRPFQRSALAVQPHPRFANCGKSDLKSSIALLNVASNIMLGPAATEDRRVLLTCTRSPNAELRDTARDGNPTGAPTNPYMIRSYTLPKSHNNNTLCSQNQAVCTTLP